MKKLNIAVSLILSLTMLASCTASKHEVKETRDHRSTTKKEKTSDKVFDKISTHSKDDEEEESEYEEGPEHLVFYRIGDAQDYWYYESFAFLSDKGNIYANTIKIHGEPAEPADPMEMFEYCVEYKKPIATISKDYYDQLISAAEVISADDTFTAKLTDEDEISMRDYYVKDGTAIKYSEAGYNTGHLEDVTPDLLGLWDNWRKHSDEPNHSEETIYTTQLPFASFVDSYTCEDAPDGYYLLDTIGDAEKFIESLGGELPLDYQLDLFMYDFTMGKDYRCFLEIKTTSDKDVFEPRTAFIVNDETGVRNFVCSPTGEEFDADPYSFEEADYSVKEGRCVISLCLAPVTEGEEYDNEFGDQWEYTVVEE